MLEMAGENYCQRQKHTPSQESRFLEEVIDGILRIKCQQRPCPWSSFPSCHMQTARDMLMCFKKNHWQ